jgi:tetratricopeptide (TPR) repeat protein
MRRTVGALVLSILAAAVSGQDRGDAAVASRYFDYALAAALDGRWADAEETLSRASDFSDVSSDVSYLLALARLRGGKPVGAALEALSRAVEAGRWSRYAEHDARLLEGECLAAIRSFDQALAAVSSCPESPEKTLVRLRALAGQGDRGRFRALARDALDAYPRDTRIVRLLFAFLDPSVASDGDLSLAETALSRLPFLLDADPFLAVLAYPFVRDSRERRDLIAAYRAEGHVSPRSVGPALELGLIADADAAAELFSYPSVDLKTLRSVFSLLRDDDGRSRFSRTAAAYSGTVSEDADGDGRSEARTVYAAGTIASFSYDSDQDGIPEVSVDFRDGLPVAARVAASLSVEPNAGLLSAGRPVASRPAGEGERVFARVAWSRYPYASEAELDGVKYEYAAREFPLAPLTLNRLVPSGDARIPQADPLAFRLTERSLLSFAAAVEREGELAPGSVERVSFVRGVAVRAVETLKGAVIARTEFDRGRPAARYLDLDLDGRMEAVQRFRFSETEGAVVDRVEIDENGDGKIDRTERY